MDKDLIIERWCKLAGIISEDKELHVFDFDDTLGVTNSATLHVAFDYDGNDPNDPNSYKPITDLASRLSSVLPGTVKTATQAKLTTDGISGDKLTAAPKYLVGAQVVALDTMQYKVWKSKVRDKGDNPLKPITYPDGNIETVVKDAAKKMKGTAGEIHAVDFTPSAGLGDVEPIPVMLNLLKKKESEGDVTAVVTARKGQTDMSTFGGGKVRAQNVDDIKDFLGDEIGEHPDYVFGAADFGNEVGAKKREIIKNIVDARPDDIDDIFFYDDDKNNTDEVQKLEDEDDESLVGKDLEIFNYEFSHGAKPSRPTYKTKIGRGKKAKKENHERRLKESLKRIIKKVVILEQYQQSYYEGVVLKELNRMAGPKGLPVTHETPAENIASIKRDGGIIGEYGIFFSIGHLKKPAFVTGSGYIIHGYLPKFMLNSDYVHPDMIYSPGETDDDDMLTGDEEDFWEVMWNSGRGNLQGALLSTNLEEWPKKYWKSIISNGL